MRAAGPCHQPLRDQKDGEERKEWGRGGMGKRWNGEEVEWGRGGMGKRWNGEEVEWGRGGIVTEINTSTIHI